MGKVSEKLERGRTLRWFRNQIMLSRAELAGQIDVSIPQVYRYEMGLLTRSTVSPAFSKRYGISIEAITAWRMQKQGSFAPVQVAKAVLSNWERMTEEIILKELE